MMRGDRTAVLASLEVTAATLLATVPGASRNAGETALAALNRAADRLKRESPERAAEIWRGLLEHPASPPWPAVGLARLAMRNQDWAAAIAAWEACLGRFSSKVAPAWLAALYECYCANEAPVQAAGILEWLWAAFPAALETLRLVARAARDAQDWRLVLHTWNKALREQGNEITLPAMLGRAEALLRLGWAKAALAQWHQAVGRFPDEAKAYTALVAGAAELGDWELVISQSEVFLARFGDAAAHPDGYVKLARGYFNLRRKDEGDACLAQAAARFPDDSQFAIIAIQQAHNVFASSDTIDALVQAMLARHPADRALRVERVMSLIGLGELDAAEAIARDLGGAADDDHALLARWWLTIARGGAGAIRAEAQALVPQLDWGLHASLNVAWFLLRRFEPWAVELALELLVALDARLPGRISVRSAMARALITLRRDSEAKAMIARIPRRYQTREVLELFAWAEGRAGRTEAARAISDRLLAKVYVPALHAVLPAIELKRAAPNCDAEEGVTAFMVMRNEFCQLEGFLAHHRALGVRRFFIVDNMSDDGSFEFMLAQPDVTLYRTEGGFRPAGSGLRWLNLLIGRHAPDGWCLILDADEAFVFPGCERLGVDGLAAYLDAQGEEGVGAFMLDMFPEQLFDAAGEAAPREASVYFDTDYAWLGQLRPPYDQPVGGARTRLFGTMEYLHKLPFFRADRVVPLDSHEMTPLRLAMVSGALLHYKLYGIAKLQDQPWSFGNRAVHVMQRYRRYADCVAGLRGVDLRAPGISARLRDSWQLAEIGLLRAPETYKAWCASPSSASTGLTRWP